MMVSVPTKSLASIRRTSGSRVLLASREIVDKHEAGLNGVAGARELIAIMEARRSVSKLILGHNSLGDAGCKELFKFLLSDAGLRFRVSEISLNANGIGDEGLEAIMEYLMGNRYLKTLSLHSNKISVDEEVALKLSLAISSSTLEMLSLNSNNLGDSFFNTFIHHMDSPTLRELQISSINITPESGPGLINFLTSERAEPLEVLKCNGNSLGLDHLRSLYAHLRQCNFTLRKLEMYGSTWTGVEALIAEESAKLYHHASEELRKVTLRNELLRNKLHEQALSLLRYSRALLLPCRRSPDTSQDPPSPDSPKTSFPALPPELCQHILSFLSSVLSVAQRARIVVYASDPSTLRPLLPRLECGSGGCVPDPATLPFGMGMGGPGFGPGPGLGVPKITPWVTSPRPSMPPPPRLCDSGKCMGAGGSVFCHRIEARNQWLAEVGCERFEASGRVEGSIKRLLA